MNLHDDGAAAPETKAYGREVREAEGALMAAFEAFKDANDERLGQIETRVAEDAVTRDKVDRINKAVTEQKAALDALALEMRRPKAGGTVERRGAGDAQAAAAFDRYVRKGDAGELMRIETKAASLSAGVDAEGGFVAPDETERTITTLLAHASPIRAIASVRQIAGGTLRLPVATGGFASGWAAEKAARPQTNSPDFAVVEFPAMELYAMPAATQSLLDDALTNVEQWIAEETRHAFAAQEGAAFVNGDGVNKPMGFLAYTKVADASWTWGQIGFVASGAASDFASSNPVDRLIDLAYAPKQIYRAEASWAMNRATEARIRKFKDADGNYVWQPGAAGQPASLLGHPVVEVEDMPGVAANAFPIAFGDFKRGYLIVDRAGIRILRDPYSAKPFVLFYVTKRVGGGVRNFEAIKLLRIAA